MLRRLSTTFRKDKKKENDQTNGHTNGTTPTEKSSRRQSYHLKSEQPDHSAKREEVSGTFEQFAQVLHAAQRPLPSQTGDGSYLNKEEPTGGLLADIKNLGFKDLKTVRELVESKAKGELVDDKTYIMERVIQVITNCAHLVTELNNITASQWSTLSVEEQSRIGEFLHFRLQRRGFGHLTLDCHCLRASFQASFER
jgi:linoleate 10R-lipoxygenase